MSSSQFLRLYPTKDNKLNGPLGRSGHRIVISEGDIYSYGGYNPDPPSELGPRNMDSHPMFKELWKFNLASQQWKLLETVGDSPNESVSYGRVLLGDKLLVLGGAGFPFADVRSNNLYCCDLKQLCWKRLKCSGDFPDKVYGHSMLALHGYIYLFGGTSGFVYSSAMHKLSLATLEWKLISQTAPSAAGISGPSARYRHEMVTDGRHLYILGGGTSVNAEPVDEIWCFDTIKEKWELRFAKPDVEHGFPEPRKCHGCVQLSNGEVVISGGLGNENQKPYDDIWKLNLTTLAWIKLPMKLRNPTFFHATATTKHDVMYTFGGVIKQNRRSRCLYKTNLGLRPLSELCWDCLCTNKTFIRLPKDKLACLGVPHHFLSRLDPLEDQAELIVASAS